MTLKDIFNSSDFSLAQFPHYMIRQLEAKITTRIQKDKEVPYVTCLVRNKEIKLTPEEAVRQLYLMTLTEDYGYPTSRMELEYIVTFGREKKRADIVIFDKDQTNAPYIIVELKSPKWKDGKEQLKGYCNGTGAPIGVWTNGESISYYHRKDPNYFEDIPNIPKCSERLSDILSERWTIEDLIAKDKLVNERKSLKDLILEMEDEVLANAGVDVFEEIFKLIFTKLYDEMESGRKPDRHLEFRNYGDTEMELKEKLQALFEEAKTKWPGVFTEDAKLMLTPSHLSVCVSSLQDVKLFNSNLDVVDEAFEYLINKSSKGEKGQYFTPRYVIDMCVRMLNPKAHETMIDTAAGSCGFPVHTIFHVWQQILESKGLKKSHLFTLEEKPQECKDYVQSKVFAIDFDEKAVRVARTLNLIAGDGQTNVLHLNTLDYERWDDFVKDEEWQETYFNGWMKLKKLRAEKNSNRDFTFDILMANPPFAGDIKESRILAKYELSKNAAGKMANKVGRDILFIERNLDFLKPGGRMAIVLPQGRFNNSSDRYIRDYIAERCRILAVVGLHGNVFKPHTGTKTSVLFVQKWDDVLCPRREDYPIFFATMQEPSKDNSGEKIHVRVGDYPRREECPTVSGSSVLCEPVAQYNVTPKQNNEYLLDDHGHLIVKHDLFNHDGLTRDGIAEAFAEFAKKERLSFFSLSPNEPFDARRYKDLLGRLEISEVLFSQVKVNKDLRMESEYWNSERMDFDCVTGADIEDFCQYGTSKDLNEEGNGYPVLRLNEFDSLFIGKPAKYCSLINYETFKSLQLKKDDVLICRTNGNPKYVGKAALVPMDYDYAFASYLFRIRPKAEVINPATLVVFLNSKYGRAEIEKYSMVGNQANFSPAKFREINIPILPKDCQQEIASMVQQAHAKLEESKYLYGQAQTLLENELNINIESDKTPNVNIKPLSQSFFASGRLDAEHYQEKYDRVENAIKGYKGGWMTIEQLRTFNARGTQPVYVEGGTLDVINSKHILEDGLDYDNFEKTAASAWESERSRVYPGDILIYTTGANIGRTATYLKQEKAVASNHVNILRTEGYDSVCLGFILNSPLGRLQTEKKCTGSAQAELYPKEIDGFLVPILPESLQHQISALVQKSFALKAESKQLLKTAKTMVEREIEK